MSERRKYLFTVEGSKVYADEMHDNNEFVSGSSVFYQPRMVAVVSGEGLTFQTAIPGDPQKWPSPLTSVPEE